MKVTVLHGCFSRFLSCTNGTKSRKASQTTTTFFKKNCQWFMILICIYRCIQFHFKQMLPFAPTAKESVKLNLKDTGTITHTSHIISQVSCC